ncbi:hypothetical protein HPB48_020179 [Haemaphysalis longicornis]|uniref:Signal transduction protein p25 n=1 Tax=Haemaphysalis longicornis TaxID=44386 RepID=A0A9J6FHM1_HAELO|nr:hypothetical protein HPB48_020179 [Haemaphysalis longicornis]
MRRGDTGPRRDARRMQVLMAEDFVSDVATAEADNGGASESDAEENCSADERTCRPTADDEIHWPLGVIQEQFHILQERIVDEVRRVMREEFYDMRMSMATPPESPAPGSPVPPTSFDGQFKAFAKFGDSKSTGDAITLSNSDKWFKQAKVIDGKKITTTDTGIYFKQVANLKEYQQFLEVIAKNKKVDVEEIKDKLSTCGPPATTRTTPVATGGAVARLTDHTKYTGTHKQRFDEAGKGRGKEGRQDVPAESGYVSGYKDEGNYSKTH